MLIDALMSALLNIFVFVVFPFGVYFAYHKLRHGRKFAELAQRVGLRLGTRGYVISCALFAMVAISVLVAWPLPMGVFNRQGSPQRPFVGLGLNSLSVAMALIYGMLKTGFAEEFFFRGMIAGSLSRRLPLIWANLVQAIIFLTPHLLVLLVFPELWGLLPVVFVFSLFAGWVRIKSGSILGPWIFHGALNLAMCLIVAFRTAT